VRSLDIGEYTSRSYSGSWRDELRVGWDTLLKSSKLQLYYLGGLLFQRGVPFLLMPWLIHLYGQHTYAFYVLFYSTVQLGGICCSLAVPLSPIAFWSRIERKQQLVITSAVLILTLLLTLGTVVSIPLFELYRRMFPGTAVTWLTLLGIAYIGQYAITQFLVSLHRATDSSRAFFAAQVLGGVALIAAAMFHASGSGLLRLVSSFLIGICVQNGFLLITSSDLYRGARRLDLNFSLARELLRYSAPLVLYTGAVLYMYWIDKYLVKLHFSLSQFSTFSITFQYAFAQAFLAQVLGFYTFPAICRHVATQAHGELKRFLLTYNLVIFVFGAVYASSVLAVHRWIYGLHISPAGFLLLSFAFLTTNLAANYVNTLYAMRRTLFVALLEACGALLLSLLIATACHVHHIELCYLSHLAVSLLILVGLWFGCRVYFSAVPNELACSYISLKTEAVTGD